MKEIKKVVIHCSDSDNPGHDDIEIIDQWHKARRFKRVGYHYFVKKDGSIQLGRTHNEQGAHTYHENHDSIGICFSGRREFTKKQMQSGSFLIKNIMHAYGLTKKAVYPHNYFNCKKTCPNFPIEDILGGL